MIFQFFFVFKLVGVFPNNTSSPDRVFSKLILILHFDSVGIIQMMRLFYNSWLSRFVRYSSKGSSLTSSNLGSSVTLWTCRRGFNRPLPSPRPTPLGATPRAPLAGGAWAAPRPLAARPPCQVICPSALTCSLRAWMARWLGPAHSDRKWPPMPHPGHFSCWRVDAL
mgnify:CR=1 FL=1